MTNNVLATPAQDTQPSPAAVSNDTPRGKVYFDIPLSEWLWNLLFMLSLSLTGLRMPLGNLLVVILLIRAFKINRELFISMLTLTAGGYAYSMSSIDWGVNVMFYLFPTAIFAMCVLRKTRPVKQTVIAYSAFALVTVIMAVKWGSVGIMDQLRQMMGYLSFCYFAVVLLCFSGEGFDIHRFWRATFSLMIIGCAFYIIDGYVLRGWVLVPCSWINYAGTQSLWYDPVLSGGIPRKYPPGLYPWALLIYPLAKYYKMRWWQWVLLIGAMLASRTSTVLFGLVLGFILAQGTFKRYIGYTIAAVAVFTALYFVDASMGKTELGQSHLRIASTIDQFTDLSAAEDDEDLSEAGTGRMAQAIPAFEKFFEDGKQWTGYGFIDNLTEVPGLIIDNELIAAVNPELKYRAVTDVEITQVRVLLTLGFIGLAIWFGFIFGICRILRGMRYAGYYTNVAIIIMIFGVGGFDSWFTYLGIFLGALSFSTVLLANKPQSLKEYPSDNQYA